MSNRKRDQAARFIGLPDDREQRFYHICRAVLLVGSTAFVLIGTSLIAYCTGGA